jgi:C4-dicarboxylate transporter DctM subunit
MALTVTATLLFLLLVSGIPVAIGLAILALALDALLSTRPLWLAMGPLTWTSSTNFIFVAVPVFILMGEILMRGGLTNHLYQAISLWVRRIPGGLLHSNIIASAIFAAIAGSSVATAATIGSVALPELRRRRYNERLVLGTLAAGGTLGILIPPSVTMIVYGLITETSIGHLFIAGIVPGLLTASLYMVVIAFIGWRWPALAPRDKSPVSLSVLVVRTAIVLPVIALIFVVLGSMYMGFATPTEAAAVGVVGAIFLTIAYRGGILRNLSNVCTAAMRTTGFVFLLVVAAMYLTFVLGALQIPETLVNFVTELEMSRLGVLLIIIGVYLLLGTVMSVFEMMVVTLPVVMPIILALEYDPVWFGIIVVKVAEIALITPPIGLVLYVLHGIRHDRSLPMSDVFIGALPFLAVDLIVIALLIAFPDIALWLPSTMR